MERVYNRTKPFTEKDKGFKDTLIWLSILKDAEKNKDTDYVICTKNSNDFDLEVLKPEFENISDANLEVVGSVQDLKEYLDNKYVLRLELKEKFSDIENEVKLNVGEIMLQINKNRSEARKVNSHWRNGEAVIPLSIYRPGTAEDKMKDSDGLDFVGMSIDNISEFSGDIYKVQASVEVVPRKHKVPEGANAYLGIPRTSLFSNTPSSSIILSVTIKFDFGTKTLIVDPEIISNYTNPAYRYLPY